MGLAHSSPWRPRASSTQPQSSGWPQWELCAQQSSIPEGQWPVPPLRACEPATVNLEEKGKKRVVPLGCPWGQGVTLSGRYHLTGSGHSAITVNGPGVLLTVWAASAFRWVSVRALGCMWSELCLPGTEQRPQRSFSVTLAAPLSWDYHWPHLMEEGAEASLAKAPRWQGGTKKAGPGCLGEGQLCAGQVLSARVSSASSFSNSPF